MAEQEKSREFEEAERRIESCRSASERELDLSRLALSELPIQIWDLDRLEFLNLAENRLTALPETIGRLFQLRKLVLSRNELAALPESIGSLARLVTLDVTENRLAALPERIGGLAALQNLSIESNQLLLLPERIGDLSQLASLDLTGNRLAVLPETIGRLAALRKLVLRRNELVALPESLGSLARLETLDLTGNRLTALPESTGGLSALQILVIEANQLTALPKRIGDLSRLVALNATGNLLTALPESIGRLAALRELQVSRNELAKLPESLGSLGRLETLDLTGNRLTSLPESVGELAGLRGFLIEGNQLRLLPETIGDLRELRSLALSNNHLSALPESLEQLPLLEGLYLHGNAELGVPSEILGPTRSDVQKGARCTNPKAILHYYRRLKRGGRRPLKEIKLILLGRGGVGKTSIVNQLVRNAFDPDSALTAGINITQWHMEIEGEPLRMNVWDFGGQEIMHAMHQFFLSRRSFYLIVLSGREGSEDEDAEYWLKHVESFGGKSPAIIILNKIGEHRFDLNRRALQQKYPNIGGFVATDCQDGHGFEELTRTLREQLSLWPDWRVSFPAAWFEIKERLAKMSDNYLLFDRYREVCKELGETEPVWQEELAGYLHDLGIALNYKDDPRLRDTHVLNPHWVTGGIYRIITAPILAENQGVLHTDDLTQILPEESYPRSMHLFLLDLMCKFELCFHYPDNDSRYLIPELLDKQQPSGASQFDPESGLCFQYRYPILPAGLLPRFIVRSHVLSQGLPRWRSGVILALEECSALVKADLQEKTVDVLVAGPVEGRRRLLAVIRSDFDRIHSSMPELKPQEMVPVPGRPGFFIPYRKLTAIQAVNLAKFVETYEDEVITLDVYSLINGVDLGGSRRTQSGMGLAVRLFYSYSRKDDALRNQLEVHLKILERKGLIAPWHDRLIRPGEVQTDEIDKELARAQIVLLLVSADYLASDYCYCKEMEVALGRHREGKSSVVPIILRPVNWKDTSFSALRVLPKGGKAVTTWANRDAAWQNVSEEIEKVVHSRRQKLN